MGRPRVPDGQRRRVAVACLTCRLSKKKCSATIPCVYCESRGLAASCSSEPPGMRQSSRFSRSSRPHSRARSSPSSASSAKMSKSEPSRTDAAVQSPDVLQSGAASLIYTGNREARTRPRFLFNLRGEQVYIGQAASLSFLQLAREIVTERIGPSDFSHNGKIQTMLEATLPSTREQQQQQRWASSLATPGIELDINQMLSYAQTFESSVDGLLSLFAPSEVKGLLVGSHAADARYRNQYKRATVDLIIAVGAQCTDRSKAFSPCQPSPSPPPSPSPSSPSSPRPSSQPQPSTEPQTQPPPTASDNVELSYFRHAQQLAVLETLEDPSVDMVRTFLLMAFYMLGSCQRNAAYMYIGVAARAAVVLGLHSRESYADMTQRRYRLRLRIWISLCVLDMTVSAILGRPAATAMLRAGLDRDLDRMAADLRGTDMDLGVLMASYKILCITSDIVDNLYGRDTVSGAFIEQYLDVIDAWKHDYSHVLTEHRPGEPHRHLRGLEDLADSRASLSLPRASGPAAIGNIHASCFYYFAITLVTRPILIRTLLVAQPDSDDGFFHTTFRSQVAQACVEAAVYLVQTCTDAQDAGILLGNMCILKALVFVAGLILGLKSFCRQQIDYEVETAFSGARRNLSFLALQSPQAAHYLDILQLLQKATDKKRQQQRGLRRSRYVSKLSEANTLEFPSETPDEGAREAHEDEDDFDWTTEEWSVRSHVPLDGLDFTF